MAILRKQKNSNFTTVNNYFINDINLKPDGKGFLLFMLSKPDDWQFNFTNFKKSLGIGEKAIRSILKKLEDLKYLKRENIRNENGRYEWNYFVYEEPYDMELKRRNLPYYPSRHMVGGDAVRGNIYQNTDITNTELTNDKIDNIDKTKNLNHKALINELVRLKYITKDDDQILLYDSLFEKLINEGNTYAEIYSSIHYIVPRVISKKFKDEDNTLITNKYGYFKASIESNFKRFSEYDDELYSENDFKLLWKEER